MIMQELHNVTKLGKANERTLSSVYVAIINLLFCFIIIIILVRYLSLLLFVFLKAIKLATCHDS